MHPFYTYRSVYRGALKEFRAHLFDNYEVEHYHGIPSDQVELIADDWKGQRLLRRVNRFKDKAIIAAKELGIKWP